MSEAKLAQPFEIRRLEVADVADHRSTRLASLRTEPESFGALHEVAANRPAETVAATASPSTASCRARKTAAGHVDTVLMVCDLRAACPSPQRGEAKI